MPHRIFFLSFLKPQRYTARKLLKYARNAIEYKIWEAILKKASEKHISFLKDLFLKVEEVEKKGYIKLEDYDPIHGLASFWSDLSERKKAEFRKNHNV